MVKPSAIPRGMIVTLCSGSAFGSQSRDQRVAGFMIRGVLLFVIADDQALAFHAHHHLVFGELEIELRDDFAILAGGHQRGFIHQVGQIGAGESRCTAREVDEIDVIGQRNFLGVDVENLLRDPSHRDAPPPRDDQNGRAAAARDPARRDGWWPPPG